jgi:hypothetical protein
MYSMNQSGKTKQVVTGTGARIRPTMRQMSGSLSVGRAAREGKEEGDPTADGDGGATWHRACEPGGAWPRTGRNGVFGSPLQAC